MLDTTVNNSWRELIGVRPGTRRYFALGLLLSAIVVITVWSWPSGSGRQAVPGPTVPFARALEGPLDDGVPTTLAQARLAVPFPVSLPSHPLANSGNLEEVFISPQHHVALVFSSNVLIILQEPDFDNGATELADLVSSGSVKNGRIDEVQGQPALVIEPDSDAARRNPGSLQFVRNGVSRTLYGEHLTGTRLKQIAETM
jgi:hypothetical protein